MLKPVSITLNIINECVSYFTASLVAQTVRNLPAMWVQSMGGKVPWRRKCLVSPVFLPGELQGQSMAVYSPWGRKELDTTKWLTHTLRLYTSMLHCFCYFHHGTLGKAWLGHLNSFVTVPCVLLTNAISSLGSSNWIESFSGLHLFVWF